MPLHLRPHGLGLLSKMAAVVELDQPDDLHGHVGLVHYASGERQMPEVPGLAVTYRKEHVGYVAEPVSVFPIELTAATTVEDLPAEAGELPLLLPCNDSRLRQRTGYSYGFYDTLMSGPHSRSGLWLEHIGKRRASGYDSAYVGDFWWKDGIRTHIIQIHNLVSCRWTTFHMVLRRRIRTSDILLPRQAGYRYRIHRCTESAGFEPAVDFSTTG